MVVENATLSEILQTIAHHPFSIFGFGSWSEGTTTLGLRSDEDTAVVLPYFHVSTKVAAGPFLSSFLLVIGENPGYAKLHLVDKGILSPEILASLTCWLSVDKNNRCCLVQTFDLPGVDCKEGPAFHIKGNEKVLSSDVVIALSCAEWPDFAQKWLSRKRIYGWPSEELLAQCKSLGFIVVSASHPASDEKQFQWRISFPHQERLLVTQFNSVQLKCYILLKIINKELIKQYIKEETLTSYHLKTCMLYILENTPSDLWVSENLVGCIIMCFRQIRVWIKEDNIPNYFVPEENMLDRITKSKLKVELARKIDGILNSGMGDVLCNLKCDFINLHLDKFTNVPILHLQEYGLKMRSIMSSIQNLSESQNVKRFHCVHQPYVNSLRVQRTDRLKYLNQKLTRTIFQMVEAKGITTHTEVETRKATSLLLPCLKLSLVSCRIVQMIDRTSDMEHFIRICTSVTELDPLDTSGKLKQASALSTLGFHRSSLYSLSSLTISAKFSLCFCGVRVRLVPDLSVLLRATNYRDDVTVFDLLRDVLQPCVRFFLHEQKITPLAINYEMLRSYVPSVDQFGRIIQLLSFYEWGAVDGHFLRRFLQYLNHTALGQKSHAIRNVKIMVKLLNSKTVCHRETCLNLLGYVHIERGEIKQAVQCFQKSLQTDRICNAAFWHMCFLINEIINKRKT